MLSRLELDLENVNVNVNLHELTGKKTPGDLPVHSSLSPTDGRRLERSVWYQFNAWRSTL